ncbi:MAG: Rrf2 family transcriptional regulator [Candidatus Omnitrophica bacterium]|nr:Rrf2 family transcriptional regulator [Candidatus Omnitrophota bacterium]
MNFISRDTDYAVRALIYMARHPKAEVVTVDDIVKKERLPERFLRRILQKLAGKGFLASNKGKGGGFSLVRSPGSIRLTDLMETFQGKMNLTNCLLKGRICPNVMRGCLLRKKLRTIGKELDAKLNKITIASLMKE